MIVGQTYKIKDDGRYIKAKFIKGFGSFLLFQAKNYRLTILKNDLCCKQSFIQEV